MTGPTATAVREPRTQRAGVAVAFPLLGAAAGWLLIRLADLVVRLDWAPMSGPFRLLARLPDPQAEIGAVAVGAVAGAVLVALAAAFTRHGYRWHGDGDPYRSQYRSWLEGAPELPVGADTLLRARRRAVRTGDREELARLRPELAGLGLVLRDEQGRQQWRRIRSGPAVRDSTGE